MPIILPIVALMSESGTFDGPENEDGTSRKGVEMTDVISWQAEWTKLSGFLVRGRGGILAFLSLAIFVVGVVSFVIISGKRVTERHTSSPARSGAIILMLIGILMAAIGGILGG